ncbi:MAG: DUF4424 family protein [Alphaproteobacteria bacterium]
MRRLVLLAFGLAAATAALGNDTTASTAAGGLVLERTDSIDMLSEDLFVSANEIRVRYVFRNQSPKDVETIVAFPMPGRDLSIEWGQDVAFPSDFRTQVDGKPVDSSLERKAIVNGRDYTALLSELKIPIAPDDIMDATRAMDSLSATERNRLQSLGLAGVEEFSFGAEPMRHHLIPLWTVQDRYWWRQAFPAGEDVIVDHRYVPGVGGSVDSPIAFRKFRGSEDSKEAIRRYCMDKAFLAAVDKASSKNEMRGPGMPDRRIDYILTTGANWRSPIGRFRLVVDKGRPGNLVSFCATGVKKIGPRQFEVVRRNWRPTEDLHVLIIEPQRW